MAVKVIDGHPNPDPMDRDRFERVTSRLADIEHPNVVAVLDAGSSRIEGHDVLWVAMPYVDRAETLEHRLSNLDSVPSLNWTRDVLAELASGLNMLHLSKIVHRDLKPENVLVLPGGQVVIIDFDIACLADDARGTPLGQTFGTLRYRAPEQFDGECGPASDLWALGVIAYEMYVGRHPFAMAGMRDEELVDAIRTAEPAPPGETRVGMSARESDLVVRMLDKVAWRRGALESANAVTTLKAGKGYGHDHAPLVSITAEARGDVDAAVSAEMHGHAPESVVVPANRDAALTAAREQLGGRAIEFVIEPSVARFALPDWEERKTLRELPYRPPAGELYDERLLYDPERLRSVARSA